MDSVPRQVRRLPDLDHDALVDTIAHLRRLLDLARERGSHDRAAQLERITAAYEAERLRRTPPSAEPPAS